MLNPSRLFHRKLRAARRLAFRPRLTTLEDRAVPSFGWAAAVGNTPSYAPGPSASVSTDSAGDVYVAGNYSGTFTPSGSSVPLTSAGASDVYVAKYSRSGDFQWATSMGGAGSDNATGIAADGAGNVFVVGAYQGPAAFGTINLTSPPNSADAFAAKLDTGGNVVWARNGLTAAGRSVDLFSPPSVAVDGAGNVYVADANKATAATDNVVTLQLANGTGATQWTDEFAGVAVKKQPAGDSEFPKLAVAGSNVYVTGYFALSVDFDPGPGTYTLNGKGGANFVAKLTTGGAFAWADSFAAPYNATAISADGDGNLYITGTFSGKVNFNPQGTLNLDGGTYGADFVQKLTPAGTLAWAKQFGAATSTSGATPDALAVDAVGAVYITGSFTGTTGFNPAGGGTLTSAGGSDIFVSKLDTNGTYQWALRAGGAGDDSETGIAVDGFGDVDLAGVIGPGTATFGDPTHSLITGIRTNLLWQITQP